MKIVVTEPLMIADEVLTGVGRTGTMWAVEHSSVVPDILVMGKHLSGGVESFAGFSAKDEILGNNPQASGGSTFAGTPAGCAAASRDVRARKNAALHIDTARARGTHPRAALQGPLRRREQTARHLDAQIV